MRFIGNKENLLDWIFHTLEKNQVKGNNLFDFFSGTTNVAQYFKKRGFQVSCSDLLYLSYCLQKAYIENNTEPTFEKLIDKIPQIQSGLFELTPLESVVNYLNSIKPIKGFIYHNYTPEGTTDLDVQRKYFSSENGGKIDAIRTYIEKWHLSGDITEMEYYILLSCLIETVPFFANIAGVYAAFHKKWDPRAIKPLQLRSIQIIKSNKEHKVYNTDSLLLCNEINTDILYLDPPYNERQYAPNYHVLETIAKYDNPEIKGITGMRDYSNQKSSFCSEKSALRDLERIASSAKYKYLILSYNSEGIMKQDDIIHILSKFGKVKLEETDYTRYKSNNKGVSNSIRTIKEQLYILNYGQ